MVTLDQAGAGIPALRIVSAPPGLRDRVRLLWLETPRQARVPGGDSWRVVPDPCAHLLYHRVVRPGGGEEAHRLLVAGPRTVAVDIDKTRRSVTAGVRLRPWAVPALLGLSAGDLSDRSVRLSAVLDGEATELEDRLRAAPVEGIPAVLEAWLRGRVTGSEAAAERRARFAVSRLARQATCEKVARGVGIGTRALRSLIRDQVGLPPKTVGRIARLHGALRRARIAGPGISWSRVAAASGYYDQAHMIREFRRLLGETPGAWSGRLAGGSTGGPRSRGQGHPATESDDWIA